MGADGISQAADISVLMNNYMEKELLKIRGVTRSHPEIDGWRLEMTRYSLEQLYQDTGVTVADVANRMVDFGVDAPWLSHEPWIVPQPLTPEAGEMWSKEDVDYWIAVLARISDEAYSNPDIVLTAPHNQVIRKLGPESLDDPDRWAMTWRAFQRKKAQRTRSG
jgi:glycine dehydrogenase subunit 2